MGAALYGAAVAVNLAAVAPSSAATFTVTTATDAALRQAVADANSTTGPDVIEIDPGVSSITLTQGDIEVTETLAIIGPEAGVVIDGNGADRILAVSDPGAALELENLVLQNGATTVNTFVSDPADIRCNDSFGDGGAVCAEGDVTLRATVVRGNRTEGEDANGGGLFVKGNLTVAASRIENNEIIGDDAGGGGVEVLGNASFDNSAVLDNHSRGDNAASGGGIALRGGVLDLINSTVANNSVASGSFADGGGLWTNRATVTLRNSTLANNSVEGAFINRSSFSAFNSTIAGNRIGVSSQLSSGELLFDSTIIADNSDLPTDFPSNGGNLAWTSTPTRSAVDSLFGDAESELDGQNSGNVFSDEPDLLPLGDYGCAVPTGPADFAECVPTMKPAFTSPALDVGAGDNGEQYDQRGSGFARNVGSAVDIGAIEARFAEIVIDPDVTDFGQVVDDVTAGPRTVTLTNRGTTALEVTSVEDPIGNVFARTGDGTCGDSPFTIGVARSCTLEYTFTPVVSGSDTQANFFVLLTVSSNAPEALDDEFRLQGEGLAPNLQFDPDALAFGDVTRGTTSGPREWILSNDGLADLAIESLTLIGADASRFTLASEACSSQMLAPNESCSVEIEFGPDEVRDFAAQLRVQLTDRGSRFRDVTGTGVEQGDAPGPGDEPSPARPVPVGPPWLLLFLALALGCLGARRARRQRAG
jgi:hypothetical protein